MDAVIVQNLESVASGQNMPPEIRSWLQEAKPEDLYRINLKSLAEEKSVDLRSALDYFLMATHAGAFNLSWEYHCPHCNAVPDFKHNFGDMKAAGFCPICDVDFRNSLDENVEVTFTIHPSLLEIPSDVEETYKNHMFGAAKERAYSLPDRFLSGLDVMNNAVFHELFGDQVLSTEESLEIQSVTILFTDIKGSTSMYTRLGDAKSYEIVREHFKLLFSAVKDYNGYVVKTIGDAVMASFIRPADAIQATIEAYRRFREVSYEGPGHLEIKMGLHTGPVITVNMNDRLDYFGNTVNIAARVEGEAKDHSISFTDQVLGAPGVKRQLVKQMGERPRVSKKSVPLKGLDQHINIYTIRPDPP